MSKLQASLVVDLVDKTGAKTSAVIGNMNRLKRAERDYMLADKGLRLSNKDKAMERLLTERHMASEKRMARMAMMGRTVSAVALVAGAAATKSYLDFASSEDKVNRILINANKGFGDLSPAMRDVQRVANQTALSVGNVTGGLESLVSAGQPMEKALAFLPSVARTAQASNSAVSDIANTADAMSNSFGISAGQMEKAFDILVEGGNAGKFELKDMSQYLPKLLPAFATIGYKGEEGLAKVVAMLQMVRQQTGSSEQAATALGNVVQKMYSNETANKFKRFGIDLPKSLDKAKKEGKDVMDTLVDMSIIATKGDLSKLPLIFEDTQAQDGMRALIQLRMGTKQLTTALYGASGAVERGLNQALQASQQKIQKMSNLWDALMTKVGGGVATVVNPALEKITNTLDERADEAAGVQGQSLSYNDLQQRQLEFFKQYGEKNPGASVMDKNTAFRKALAQMGRGEIKDVMDFFNPPASKEPQVWGPSGRGTPQPWEKVPIPAENPRSDAYNRRMYGEGQLAAQRAMRDAVPSMPTEFRDAQDALNASLTGTNGSPNIGAVLSDKIAEGGDKAATAMQSQANTIGSAIGAAFLSKVSGALGSFMANPGGGQPRSTGQAVQQQSNGQFIDAP
ncbi:MULTISPECIES: phage tail tape measure protein [Rhizobium/Agrobacterium group]|nr:MULTISPECIES: phage tail tape measure protein [Rhizobium/Agrobacterium group]MUO27426.1 phage tail tape measure protein [Agrobacterium vitis]MUO42124.1 phage tail tape measure protein [Agrobacterium vitis]